MHHHRAARSDRDGPVHLSPGTRNIIAKIAEPITLRFYFSKKVAADYAQTVAYAKRVRDLLGEYAALSHGKIILEEIDPEPFTPAEDEATANGLTGAPTDSGDTVYFGLVGTNRIDGKEVIPFFTPEREPYLEYDLTSLIYHLSMPQKPVLGIISSLPLETGAGGMAGGAAGHVAALCDLFRAARNLRHADARPESRRAFPPTSPC